MFKPGNQEWRKGRLMAEALRIELVQYEKLEQNIKRGEAPRAVAKKAIEAALSGEAWAIAFIYDRLDGKPHQTIDQTVDVKVETVSDEQARLMAEAFIESARAGGGVCPEEPDRIHDRVPAGLPSGPPAPSNRKRAPKG